MSKGLWETRNCRSPTSESNATKRKVRKKIPMKIMCCHCILWGIWCVCVSLKRYNNSLELSVWLVCHTCTDVKTNGYTFLNVNYCFHLSLHIGSGSAAFFVLTCSPHMRCHSSHKAFSSTAFRGSNRALSLIR